MTRKEKAEFIEHMHKLGYETSGLGLGTIRVVIKWLGKKYACILDGSKSKEDVYVDLNKEIDSVMSLPLEER